MSQTPVDGSTEPTQPVVPPPPSGPRHDPLHVHLSRKALGYLRTTATMVVLAAILVVAVAVGWHKATPPFPSLTDTSTKVCTDLPVAQGDPVTPEIVTVSVLNAGSDRGASERTLGELTDDGFSEGRFSNAPAEAKVADVEIWSSTPKDPAVKLVESYLGKRVKVVDKTPTEPGVNVVVGDAFTGIVKGLPSVKATADTTVCGP